MNRRIVALALLLASLTVLGQAAVSLAQEGGNEAVQGTIRSDDEPVPGVVIQVTADGEPVEAATTDDEGAWFVALPGPGEYAATVDPDTLPEGTSLRNPDRATLEFTISPNQQRRLLFPLGEARDRGGDLGRRAAQLFVEGIKFGLIIAMSSIGLSLVFGTTGLVNFAHGEIVTLGALATWFFNVLGGVHVVPAAVLGIVVTAIAGGAFDRVVWRPLRQRGSGLIAMLVVSIGASILLRYFYLYLFGGRTRPFAQYNVQTAIDLGPVGIAPKDLIGIVLGTFILIGVGLALNRTRLGRAVRAVADNPDLAEASGINQERVIALVWVVGSGLAALGGILLGLAEQTSWQMGFQLLLLMFAAVTLGGIGTAYGAFVGSLVVGVFIQMSTLVISPELKNVGALSILVLILLVRPQGIFGTAERVG